MLGKKVGEETPASSRQREHTVRRESGTDDGLLSEMRIHNRRAERHTVQH